MEQKLSVVILGLCGAMAIGLSLYRIQASVRAPFLVDKNAILATKKLVGSSPAEEVAKQKRTDTDGDGLSDWDEINVFHTNPNLRDTCGDGVPDNIRVVTGKNVGCAGQQGNQSGYIDLSQVTPSATSTFGLPSSSPLMPQMPQLDMAGLMQAASGSTGSQQHTPTDVSQILPRDPDAIRAALKGRIDDAKLQQISDEDLLKIYDQAVAQFTQQQGTSTSTQ